MDTQRIAKITRQLGEAVAALSHPSGDLPAPAIEQLDVATREALEAIYRARAVLQLPALQDASIRQVGSTEVARHSRVASRTGATERAKSDRIAKTNAAFFQQMNLAPALDARQVSAEQSA